ncbi:MAG: ParA family protein [Puniceicoccaceae bacterium]
MKILSIYNMKGGVGKTATAVNLSHLAARSGHRTLLCDFDPQGAATYYLRIEPDAELKARKLLKGKTFAHQQVKESDFQLLDVLPAHLEFRNFDLFLDQEKKSRKRLGKLLRSFAEEYDLLVIDAPPNITLLSENIFHASDLLLIPVIPTTLSLRTYAQIRDFFRSSGLDFSKTRGFFSMVDRRKNLHCQTIQSTLAEKPFFLPAQIPLASVVEQMGPQRLPLAEYAPRSPSVGAYRDLLESTLAVLGILPVS